VGRLPKGAVMALEMPRDFAQLLHARPLSVKWAKNRRVVAVTVNPSGRTTFAEVAFPAKARIPLRLLVNVPKELRKNEFEIFARQLYEKEEVGRVTWRLVPPRKRE
jgi:serine protease